jgi:hypothetical protein
VSKSFSYQDIFSNLCSKDRRNPMWRNIYGYGYDEDEIPEPRIDCSCDNCFYHRDSLALEILRLRGIVDDLHSKTSISRI